MSFRWLVAALLISIMIWLSYGILIMDPMSGPDAPTYASAGPVIAQNGFTRDIPGVPYWPIGYPAFLAFFYLVSSAFWMPLAIAFQVLMLSGAIVLVRVVAKEWAGPFVANASYLILLFLPSLTAASTQLMYEVPLASLLALWAWAMSRVLPGATQSKVPTPKPAMLWALTGGLSIGAAVCIQPKTLPLVPIGLLIQWVVVRYRVRIVYILSAALLPASVMAMNWINFGRLGISWNLGTTMSIRNEGRLSHCGAYADEFTRDSSLIRCNLLADLADPIATASLYLQQALWHLWPLSGPQSQGSTWFHALSIWRLDGAEDQVVSTELIRRGYPAAAIILLAVPFATGLLASRGLPWRLTALLASAPLLLLTVSIVVRGDGRFRIPGVLLATPVWVLSVTAAVQLAFPSEYTHQTNDGLLRT
jgi:hypothetical protein